MGARRMFSAGILLLLSLGGDVCAQTSGEWLSFEPVKVKLEGKVIVKERSKEEVEHLESEGAKGAAAAVSIEATGVVIDRPAK